jgi:hypothetical protein
MNNIKSDKRNLLCHKFLQAALRVAVQTLFDHDTFPFDDALKVWLSEKPRRERQSKKWLAGQKRKSMKCQVARMKRAKTTVETALYKKKSFFDTFLIIFHDFKQLRMKKTDFGCAPNKNTSGAQLRSGKKMLRRYPSARPLHLPENFESLKKTLLSNLSKQ